jgi:hypothetical protein
MSRRDADVAVSLQTRCKAAVTRQLSRLGGKQKRAGIWHDSKQESQDGRFPCRHLLRGALHYSNLQSLITIKGVDADFLVERCSSELDESMGS